MSTPSVFTTLAINRQSGGLIAVGNSSLTMPAAGQRNSKWYLIQLYDPPTQSIGGIYNLLTPTQLGSALPRMTIYSKATPQAGDENTYVLAKLREGDFTWNATLNGYLGLMNFNTTQLQDYMIVEGSVESVTVECEIDWSDSGNISTLVFGEKNPITIYAQGDEGGDPPVDIINGVVTYKYPANFVGADGTTFVLDKDPSTGLLGFTLLP